MEVLRIIAASGPACSVLVVLIVAITVSLVAHRLISENARQKKKEIEATIINRRSDQELHRMIQAGVVAGLAAYEKKEITSG